MSVKLKRKNWLFAAFILSLIVILIWLKVLFVDMDEISTFNKVVQWLFLIVCLANATVFFLAYKNALKKTELKNKDPDL